MPKQADVPAGLQCSHSLAPKKRCPQKGSVYAMSGWWCSAHIPAGDPSCTHSLSTSGRCSYCGADVTKTNGGIDPAFGVALTLEEA